MVWSAWIVWKLNFSLDVSKHDKYNQYLYRYIAIPIQRANGEIPPFKCVQSLHNERHESLYKPFNFMPALSEQHSLPYISLQFSTPQMHINFLLIPLPSPTLDELQHRQLMYLHNIGIWEVNWENSGGCRESVQLPHGEHLRSGLNCLIAPLLCAQVRYDRTIITWELVGKMSSLGLGQDKCGHWLQKL